jgi:hypothetical protein
LKTPNNAIHLYRVLGKNQQVNGYENSKSVLFIKKHYDTNSDIKKNELYELAQFVVKENSTHHRSDSQSDAVFLSEVKQLYQEDISLFEHSIYYTANLGRKIIGSVKVTLWDGEVMLPIEKLFGISCRQLASYYNKRYIWHVGRLAISKKDNPSGISLLMRLLTLAIGHICEHAGSLMIAECDKKLLRVLNLLNIQVKDLGEGIIYLGSETIPVYATDELLAAFLYKNPYVRAVKRKPGFNERIMWQTVDEDDIAAMISCP